MQRYRKRTKPTHISKRRKKNNERKINGGDEMSFWIGFFVGGIFGVVIFAVLVANKDERR